MHVLLLLLVTSLLSSCSSAQDTSGGDNFGSDISAGDFTDISGSDPTNPPGPTSTNDSTSSSTTSTSSNPKEGGKSIISSKNQCDFDAVDDKGTKFHYDVSALSRPNGEGKDDYQKEIQVGPNIQFVYRMNICADTMTTCQNEPSPATESLKIPAGETCRILGRRVDQSDPIVENHGTFEVVDSLNNDKMTNPSGKDLIITYNNGDLCDPAKQTMRSVSIHLVCDTSLAPADSVFKDVKKEATCNTEYIFHSKFACPTSGRTSPTKWLLMAIIGFFLYFLTGAVFSKYYYGAEGKDLIPNREFWEDVPNLTREGCTYSYEKMMAMKENGLGGTFGSFGGGGESGGGESGGGGGSGSGTGSASQSAYGSSSPDPMDSA